MKKMSMKELRAHIKEVGVDNVKWALISQYKKLPESFIREFADLFDWSWLSQSQKLSEGFIRNFADRVDWTQISICQKLSEDFIREFAHKVNWRFISRYQELSESFIWEFAHKVDWFMIPYYQKLSKSFTKEFTHKLPSNFDRVIASMFQCGYYKRAIHIHESNPTIIHIGCFEGTKFEALAAVDKKHRGEVAENYKRKIRSCFRQVGR